MFKSFLDAVVEAVKNHPEKAAFIYLPESNEQEILSYSKFLQLVLAFAKYAKKLTGKANPTISFAMDNSLNTQVILWGSQVTGSANPVNPFLSAAQIDDIICACNADVLFLDEKYKDKGNQINGAPVIIVEREFSRILEEYIDFPEQLVGEPNKIAAYFHTGGTTGLPKIVPLSHQNSIANSLMMKKALNSNSDDVFLCGLPLFHVNAIHITSLVPFSTGSTIVLPESGFRNKAFFANFWNVVERHRVSLFSSVPTILTDLLSLPVTAGQDLSSLRYAIAGAAPLSIEVFNRFERMTGLKILEGYGLTESTCAVCCNPISGARKVGSVGLPTWGCDVRIAKVNKELCQIVNECSTDEVGHILIKGPNVFSGYLRQEDNDGVWFDGWFDTGDLGCVDADGFLWLTGRSKDIIIRGGHHIDPKIVEEALYKHPDVKIAACVGRPDKRLGEVPVGFVSLNDESNLTAPELRIFLKKSDLEKASIPAEIVFIKQFPLTAVGKIYKPELRKIASES